MTDYSAPSTCKCYWAPGPGQPLVSSSIERRAIAPDDVAIDIKYAGICHSDIHQVREEWGAARFPMVPGHEIGGIVAAVGSNVTKFAIGDAVCRFFTNSYNAVSIQGIKIINFSFY